MSASERRKGQKGEREVRKLLEASGFTVRGLEGGGDHLASATGLGLTLHSECKRQEVARPWLWDRQSNSEAPAGTVPVVFFRRSHSDWLVQLRASVLLGALKASYAAGVADGREGRV